MTTLTYKKAGVDTELAYKLVVPTRIYVPEIERLAAGFRQEGHIILGLAHITGGGLVENVPRVLPRGSKAAIRRGSWRVPGIFSEIRRRGNVPEAEMWRTFNMGIGMVIAIRPNSLALAQKLLPEAALIGEIVRGKSEVSLL